MHMHHQNPKHLVGTAMANKVDPDQTAPREQSDQGLHCLQVICIYSSYIQVIYKDLLFACVLKKPQ